MKKSHLLILALGMVALPLRAAEKKISPGTGIGLGGVNGYNGACQFVDMMRHSREWRKQQNWKAWRIIEDKQGWPIILQEKATGKKVNINAANPIFMYMYHRRITGDVVLTWEGDGEASIIGPNIIKKVDNFPQQKRRVYMFTKEDQHGVFDLRITRSNPQDHIRNIHMWMPGYEGSKETFNPDWKKNLESFTYFRFMDWGSTNNSHQKEWKDRKQPDSLRQTGSVAYEYMIQICNEMNKDPWICIPHQASDDYVRQLAELIKKRLKPNLKVYIEYSNEIWNPAFQQTHWLWAVAKKECTGENRERPWEGGAEIYGRKSARIWQIMAKILSPERIIRTMAHFRYLAKAMGGALDKKYGDGRVDLIALNGYFINQDALNYVVRELDSWDQNEAFDVMEQIHLLKDAMIWKKEMAMVKKNWPGIPITCYEGGQHLANPFDKSLQGDKLAVKMKEVNASPKIKHLYQTALESWHLVGGDSFTPFVDVGTWGRYGCWGHKEYYWQPLKDKIEPKTGKVIRRGAHKFVAITEYAKRWQNYGYIRISQRESGLLDDVPMASKMLVNRGLCAKPPLVAAVRNAAQKTLPRCAGLSIGSGQASGPSDAQNGPARRGCGDGWHA